MLPSGICFCQRRIGAPLPTSKTSRKPGTSTRVLFPKRSADGIGLPVPSSVTVILPLLPLVPPTGPPPQPFVCAVAPPAPPVVLPPAPPCPPPLPEAPHWLVGPPLPPTRPPRSLLLQAA